MRLRLVRNGSLLTLAFFPLPLLSVGFLSSHRNTRVEKGMFFRGFARQ
jgi:hypothetical protein